MYKRMAFFLSLLVLVALACSISGNPTSQAPVGNNPLENKPAGTPPADPVNINDGLASLNSYQMTILINSSGPDPAQSSNSTVEIQHDKYSQASVTHFNLASVKPGSDPSNTDNYMYRIGNDQCSGSEGNWSWTSMPANQAEMMDIIAGMLGITPLIDTPTFVAQETVNGIPSNHFTFKVTGLGVESGAEVTANQGDYWLAVDGQYIVKYVLTLGTSMDPQTDVLNEEISIELTQVNQPVSIAFPQGCLDASLVTPTP
jgi:hypothetical protein